MIQESPKSVPGMVILLGGLWIAAAVGLLVWSVGLLLLFGVIRNFAPGGTDPLPPAPPVVQPLYWAFEHYVVTGSVLGALALLGLYGGIQFLRLKQWAHTFLQAGGWTAIALSVVIGIWQSQFWVDGGPHGTTMKLFAGFMVTAFYIVYPMLFVLLLRSRWVRPAFSSPASPESRPGLQ